MGEFTIAEISEHIGRELGVSDWVTIDQSRIDTSRIARAIISGSTSTLSGPSAKARFAARSPTVI